MKTASSFAILFLAAGALAQNPAGNSISGQQLAPVAKNSQLQRDDLVPPPNNQEGCPVVFTSARLNRPAEFMPTAPDSRTSPQTNLQLQYSNPSGKEIASIDLTGYLRVKQNRYALDATDITMPLTFKPATGELSTEARIPLLKNIVGFDRLTLNSVIYKDGGVWHSAKEHRTCSFASRGTERVAK